MKKYLAYIRVSTVRQGEHSSSLQEQKTAIESYAAKHGLAISGWFEEMETAAKLGRTMFNRLLSELQNGRTAGVIIHKIDRSARNLKDWARLADLIDLGIEVHFAHESLDLASRGGRLAADIQAVVAADYVRNLRQEVKKGFYGRLKQGLYPLPAPRGYLDQGKAKSKIIDPVDGPLIAQLFELYAKGAHPFLALLKEMHSRGLRGKTGKPLTLNALSRILHNPFYIGLIRIERTGETYQGVHEPLISVATFNRVQALMSGRTYARPQRHDLFFRRLIRCKTCGFSLIGERQKGRVYYRCHSASCRGTSVREELIHEAFQIFRERAALSPVQMQEVRDLVDNDSDNAARQAAKRAEDNKRLLALCEARLMRLTDAFLDGSIDKDLFEERKAQLLVERRSLQDEIGKPPTSSVGHGILKNIELVQMAPNLDKLAYSQEVREIVEIATSNFSVCGKEIVIEPKFPFAQLFNWKISQCGEPYSFLPRTGYILCALSDTNYILKIKCRREQHVTSISKIFRRLEGSASADPDTCPQRP